MSTRIYFIYGWGGKSLLSTPFAKFKDRLQGLGYDVHDDIGWGDPDSIIKRIHEQPKGTKTVLIGHSMGANATSWIASAGQPIELIVAYDPSGGWLFWNAALPNPIGKNVKKTLCYINDNNDGFAPATFTGHNVTVISTRTSHLGMMWDESLHQLTIKALEKL